MKTILRYFLSVFFCFTLSKGNCEVVPFKEFNFGIEQGLVHSGVCDIIRDSRGYLWFATYNGITIYNGSKARNVYNGVDGNSLCSNRVRSLVEDSRGNIWIGTEQGLNIYSVQLDSYSELPLPHFESHSRYIIKKLIASENAVYAVAEGFGLLKYDLNGNLVESVEMPKGVEINHVVALDGDNLLLATSKGLMQCISMELSHVAGWDDNKSVMAICDLGDGVLYIAPEHGYMKCDYKVENVGIVIENQGEVQYPNFAVFTIDADLEGGVWVGTKFDGVIYVSKDNKTTEMLPKERISGFCVVPSGAVWCATYDSGAVEFYKGGGGVVDLSSKAHGVDLRFARYCKWGGDKLLVRTMNQELYSYNIASHKFSTIDLKFNNDETLAHKTLQSCSDGTVLVILDNHTFIKLAEDGSVQRITSPLLSRLPNESPLTSAIGSDGELWLGYSNALYRVQLSKLGTQVLKVESVADNNYFESKQLPKTRAIYLDSDNIAWIGTTSEGLIKIEYKDNIQSSDIQSVKGLSQDFISSVIRTRNGVLYVGTEGRGLFKMNGEGQFTQVKGLSNNIVKSITEDKNGALWVATNYGLNRLKDENTNHVEQFYRPDGLAFDEFRYESECFSSGDLVFGSSNNIMVLNPEDLLVERSALNLEFSSLRIANDPAAVREVKNGRVILNHALSDDDTIELKHNENIFAIGVDVLGGKPLDRYIISYKLSPLSSNWIDVAADEIALSGLESGSYTLKVKALSTSGQESAIKTLHMEILPPYWATTAAYVIYIVIALVILGAVFFTVLRFMRLKYAKNHLEKLNSEKQQYFSNIAHELKTPLSLIIAPIDSLAQRFRFDVDITSKVDIIRRQSRRMLQLIESTHRLHLDEINMLKLSQQSFDFGAFLAEMVDDFRFSARYDSKNFEYESYVGLFVEGDRTMLEMAISNLLINAFKYTNSGDTISVKCRTENGELQIVIADSGVGISADELPLIFDRYYTGRGELKRSGSGIGLSFTHRIVELHGGQITAKSVLGSGTEFMISLPIIVNSWDETKVQSPQQLSTSYDSIVLPSNSEQTVDVDSKWRDSLVFVVEDDSEMRAMITDVLSPYFRVRAFSGGDECLAQMATLWPSIVISDVMMDGGDGYSLCRKIKGELSTSHIPVILLTGCTSLDDKMHGFDAGADEYIDKPFYTSHLIGRIGHILSSREELRKRFEVGIPLEMGDNKEMVKQENDFLKSLYELFEKNLDNELLDMDFVASEFGLSRSTLYQKVRSLTDSTPFELLKIYRLKRAAAFLEGGQMNVNEVVMAVGFKNRSHFVKVFKEHYDVSPSFYAKSSKGNK